MKKIFFTMLFLAMPIMTFAQNESQDEFVETTKYIKTIYVNNEKSLYSFFNSVPLSYSTEISEDEYENYDPNNLIEVLDTQQGTVETNYKKMTTSIMKISNSIFRYTVSLEWKTMPSTRSNDIIGVGFSSNVKTLSNFKFEQNYCLSTGKCYTDVKHTLYTGNNGVGASFSLPTSNIKNLSQKLVADVTKRNSSSTILKQNAYGDYSHAQKAINSSDAKKYIVDTGGIKLNSSISDYYDEIKTAVATWTGTW